MSRHWSAAVTLEPAAEARSECDGTGEGDHAADGVHDGRAGEVTEERAARAERLEQEAGAVLQPAARSPDPVAEDRVDEAGNGDAVEDVALERRPADHGARRDGRRGVGECELEQPEREERDTRGPVGRRHAVQEEVLVPDEPVAVPELEREADRPVEETAQARVEHALQQHVDGLTRSGEARLQTHEPRLHEEHEERGHEHPYRVDGADEVVRGVMHDAGRCSRGGVQIPVRRLHRSQEQGDRSHLARQDDRDQLSPVLVLQSGLQSCKHLCNIETAGFPSVCEL